MATGSGLLGSLALAFLGIFVALDIVGTLPMYVGMTSSLSRKQRDRVINQSMATAFVVAVGFAFVGKELFKALGIGIFDFRIAGGLVLLLISLADLIGNPEVEKRASGETGIVPLAVPLLTGPAVLTTVILQITQFGYPIMLLALFSNYALGWLVMRQSHVVTRLIGRDGTVVISKLAALLLAAIAIAMIRSGVFEAIGLFHSG